MNYTNGDNPFDTGYIFYDDIVVKDAKKAASRMGVGMSLWIIAFYVFALTLNTLFFALLGPVAFENLVVNEYYTAFISFFCLHLIGIPILWLVIKKLPKRMIIKKSPMSVTEFLFLIPIGQFLMYAGSIIGLYADTFLSVLFGKETGDYVANMADSMPLWLFSIIAVIIGPLFEEFVFRGLMFDRLSIYGNIFATVFTASLFALFHGNLQQLYYAFLFGLILGYIRSKTGSFKVTFIFHAITNLISGLIPTLLAPYYDGFSKALEAYMLGDGDTFIANINEFMLYGSFSMIQTVLMIAGGIMLFRMLLKKKIKFENNPEVEIPKKRLPDAIFKNIGIPSFIVVSILLILANYI